jgi:hypothetical protein
MNMVLPTFAPQTPSQPTSDDTSNSTNEAESTAASSAIVPATPNPVQMPMRMPVVVHMIPIMLPRPPTTPSQPTETNPLQGQEQEMQMTSVESPMMLLLTVVPAVDGETFGLDAGMDDQAFNELLNRLMQMHQPQGPPPAAKEAIESLPLVTIDEETKNHAGRCSVCLEDFEIGKQAVKMPCNHYFDKECVESWLNQHNTCPVCRHALPAKKEEVEQKVDSPALSQSATVQNIEEISSESTPTTSEASLTNSGEDVQPMIIDTPQPVSEMPSPMDCSESSVHTTTPVNSTPVNSSTQTSSKDSDHFGGMKKGFLQSSKKENSKQTNKQQKDSDGSFLNGLKRGFLSSPREKTNSNKKVKF